MRWGFLVRVVSDEELGTGSIVMDISDTGFNSVFWII